MIPVNKPIIYKEMYTLTKKAFDTAWLSAEGPMVELFEEKISSYHDTKYGVATNSGTTALHLALATLQITKGDEVIVPSLTIASCYFAVWYTGATAVPVDVDSETYGMNPNLIEQAITKKTKAIMVVHLYGHPCDMDPIMKIAKKHHLYVIEDAAEAHGATYKGKKVGSFGDVSIFSFYANKIVTCGEGGMLITNNASLYTKAKRLKNLYHSKSKRFIHDGIGYNYQMTNLQAAVGLASFAHIDESIQQKREMASFYTKHLQNIPGIITPIEKPWAKNVYWMYAIQIQKKLFGKNRDEVSAALNALQIQTRPFFYSPKTAFKKMGIFTHTSCPVAERAEKQGLYLPSGLGNTHRDFKEVVQRITQINTPLVKTSSF